ncbi:MAG: hypothetical protein D6805_02320, partial [Planctomycetota bacterium]
RWGKLYQKNEALRRSVDLYGVGKVFLTCLSGSPYTQIVHLQIRGKDALEQEFWTLLEDWLFQMVAPEWQKRPSTAKEALKKLLQIDFLNCYQKAKTQLEKSVKG